MKKRNPQQMGLALEGVDAPQFVNSHHQAAMPAEEPCPTMTDGAKRAAHWQAQHAPAASAAIKCDRCDEWRAYDGDTMPAGVMVLDSDGNPGWICASCTEGSTEASWNELEATPTP